MGDLVGAKRLRYVVQKLFKITIKMDNFSELSEVGLKFNRQHWKNMPYKQEKCFIF